MTATRSNLCPSQSAPIHITVVFTIIPHNNEEVSGRYYGYSVLKPMYDDLKHLTEEKQE
jgi:hypothetical protein